MNDQNARLINRYLQLCESKGLSPKTVDGYRFDLAIFANFIGGKGLPDVTHIDIEDFLFYCKNNRNNGTDAIIRKYNTINMMYETLIRKDYITGIKNPMYKVDRIKPSGEKIKEFLTKEEVAKLIEYVESIGDLRGLAYLSLSYSSAARISEIVQLNRDSLDLSNRQFVVFGKGQKYRTCIFSEFAKGHIVRYLNSRTDNLEPLFLSREGNRWSKSSIEQYVPRIVLSAGINKHITPHSLRHSILTNFRLEGAPIEDLQLLAGHANISTTQRKYTHVGLLDIRNKFDKFYCN